MSLPPVCVGGKGEEGFPPTILDFHRNSAEYASRARHCPLFSSRNQVFESRGLSSFQLSTPDFRHRVRNRDSTHSLPSKYSGTKILRLTSSLARVTSSFLDRFSNVFEGRTGGGEFERRAVIYRRIGRGERRMEDGVYRRKAGGGGEICENR